MKKLLWLAVLPMVMLFCVHADAAEYSFSFDGATGEKSLSEMDGFIEKLPDDIRDKLADIETDGAEGISRRYSVNFFMGAVKEALGKALEPALKMLCAYVGIVILACSFRALAATVSGGELSPIFGIGCGLCSALAVYSVQSSAFSLAESMLEVTSSTMLTFVPVIEAVYISCGNTTLAAVSSTGIGIMISFVQSLCANVLTPVVSVCFMLAAVAAVTGNKGVAFMSKTLRGAVTGVLAAIMTLMTFVFALQSSAAEASDSFGIRSVKYALSSYIPIVGGAVSDSFSVLRGSLSLIKNLSGITGIVVIILLLLPPLASLVLTRLTVSAAGAVAGMLDCPTEREIFSELGSTFTLMLAITVSAAVMFIFALSVFCRSAVALG